MRPTRKAPLRIGPCGCGNSGEHALTEKCIRENRRNRGLPLEGIGKLDPLRPSASLLVKVGSIIVHAEEAGGPACAVFDVITTRQLLNDPEVQEWLAGMRRLALLPVKR